MKKSELKQTLKEILAEVLPEVLEEILSPYASMSDVERYISEVVSQTPTPKFVEQVNINRSQITETEHNPYGTPSTPSAVPKPQIGQSIITEEGEKYTSGQGLLDWFANSKKPDIVERSEFKHSNEDMNNLIANIAKKTK